MGEILKKTPHIRDKIPPTLSRPFSRGDRGGRLFFLSYRKYGDLSPERNFYFHFKSSLKISSLCIRPSPEGDCIFIFLLSFVVSPYSLKEFLLEEVLWSLRSLFSLPASRKKGFSLPSRMKTPLLVFSFSQSPFSTNKSTFPLSP